MFFLYGGRRVSSLKLTLPPSRSPSGASQFPGGPGLSLVAWG